MSAPCRSRTRQCSSCDYRRRTEERAVSTPCATSPRFVCWAGRWSRSRGARSGGCSNDRLTTLSDSSLPRRGDRRLAAYEPDGVWVTSAASRHAFSSWRSRAFAKKNPDVTRNLLQHVAGILRARRTRRPGPGRRRGPAAGPHAASVDRRSWSARGPAAGSSSHLARDLAGPVADRLPVAVVALWCADEAHRRTLFEAQVALVQLAAEDPVFPGAGGPHDRVHGRRVRAAGLRRIPDRTAREEPQRTAAQLAAALPDELGRGLRPSTHVGGAAEDDRVVGAEVVDVVGLGNLGAHAVLGERAGDGARDLGGG